MALPAPEVTEAVKPLITEEAGTADPLGHMRRSARLRKRPNGSQ